MGQFKKGQSGNPGGRPKSKPFTDALRIAVLEADGDMTKLRRIATKVVEMAMNGDMQAIKEIGDRLEGKPHQSMDVNDNRTDVSDEERRARIAELLERTGAFGTPGASGAGEAEDSAEEPEGIRPLH